MVYTEAMNLYSVLLVYKDERHNTHGNFNPERMLHSAHITLFSTLMGGTFVCKINKKGIYHPQMSPSYTIEIQADDEKPVKRTI